MRHHKKSDQKKRQPNPWIAPLWIGRQYAVKFPCIRSSVDGGLGHLEQKRGARSRQDLALCINSDESGNWFDHASPRVILGWRLSAMPHLSCQVALINIVSAASSREKARRLEHF